MAENAFAAARKKCGQKSLPSSDSIVPTVIRKMPSSLAHRYKLIKNSSRKVIAIRDCVAHVFVKMYTSTGALTDLARRLGVKVDMHPRKYIRTNVCSKPRARRVKKRVAKKSAKKPAKKPAKKSVKKSVKRHASHAA